MLTQHHPVARVLQIGRIKQEIPGTEIENKQNDRILKLGDARKLSNAGNRDIDAIIQDYCDTSSSKNVHDMVIEAVQGATWVLRVHYGEVNARGFIGQ